MTKKDRFYYLAQVFIDGTISEEEAHELYESIDKSQELKQKLFDQVQISAVINGHFMHDRTKLYRQVLASLKTKSQKLRMVDSIISELDKESSKRKIFREHKRSRFPRIIWISIAACLMIMAGAYFFNIYQMHRISGLIQAKIMERQGKVNIFREKDDAVIPAEKGMYIHAGDRLELKRSSECIFEYIDDKSRVRAGSGKRDTHLTLNDNEKGKRMHLESGDLHIQAAKQPDGKPMLLTTPHALVQVVGTEFTLRVINSLNSQINNSGSNRKLQYTYMDVAKGIVRLTRLSDKESVNVAGGTFAVASGKLELKTYPAGTMHVAGNKGIGGTWVFSGTELSELQHVAEGKVSADPDEESEIKYRDGRIVFQDDFEQGLGKWEFRMGRRTVGHGGSSISEPYIPGPGRRIQTLSVRRREQPTLVLFQDNKGLRGREWINSVIRDWRCKGDFSVEYDLRLIDSRHKEVIRGWYSEGRTIQWPVGHWCHVREEFIRLVGAKGRRLTVWRKRVSVKGGFRRENSGLGPYDEDMIQEATFAKRIIESHCRPRIAEGLLLPTGGGAEAMWVDNVVVRELVPINREPEMDAIF